MSEDVFTKLPLPLIANDASVSVGVNRNTGFWNLWIASEYTDNQIEFECREETLAQILKTAGEMFAFMRANSDVTEQSSKQAVRRAEALPEIGKMLLDALKAMLPYYCEHLRGVMSDPEQSEIVRSARAAIAKAEGL